MDIWLHKKTGKFNLYLIFRKEFTINYEVLLPLSIIIANVSAKDQWWKAQ